tara:strand:+ start:21895 stop:22677 length:783 start_codon:yes stop_codon:yes gene_type:complete
LILKIGNIKNMIISHKHKYIFVGLPFSGSSAISKELIEKYDGESIFTKHSNIQSVIKHKTINIKDYFVFAVYRDPIEINKSIYSKYINNTKGVFTDKKYLIKNGGHISKKSVNLYHYIKSNNTTFLEFIKLNNNRFLPYDNVFSINEKYLDFVINFKNISDDFEIALNKIGIKSLRPLPIYNKTKDKIFIKNPDNIDLFYPYYNRKNSLFINVKLSKLNLFMLQVIYHLVHPIRKLKWLKMDRKRTDKRDEYFSKFTSEK